MTFTGSTGAGRAVAGIAGRALKKTVLELGGSDPFIVLADADIAAAADYAVRSRFQNNGQSCIATKRIILEEAVADEFTAQFLGGVARLVDGRPADAGGNRRSPGPGPTCATRSPGRSTSRSSAAHGSSPAGGHPTGPASTTSRRSLTR